MSAPEYRVFDAACLRASVLLRSVAKCADPECSTCRTYRAKARHALDTAAVAVCREVRDETCDLMEVRAS